MNGFSPLPFIPVQLRRHLSSEVEPVEEKIKEAIETLMDKAKNEEDSSEALRFSQAALNLANVRLSMRD